jgi:hypothetical protein
LNGADTWLRARTGLGDRAGSRARAWLELTLGSGLILWLELTIGWEVTRLDHSWCHLGLTALLAGSSLDWERNSSLAGSSRRAQS